MKLAEWLLEFERDKRRLGSIAQHDSEAVHSVERYVDDKGVQWETGFTYTGRLVVRSGVTGSDSVSITWRKWETLHMVEIP